MNVKFFNKSSEERRNMILSEKVLKTIIILTIPMFMMGIVQALIRKSKVDWQKRKSKLSSNRKKEG